MNSLDSTALLLLNSAAQRSESFDYLVTLVAHSQLLKGGFVMTLLWWAWFRPGPLQSKDRERIFTILLGGFAALGIGRILQLALPFRQRPIHLDHFEFQLPLGATAETLQGWSSFPSDHAVVFFALAAGCFYISRPLGWITLIHATVVVSLPRVYLGLHYPTDILAGAAVGMAAGWLMQRENLSARVGNLGLGFAQRRPSLFYSLSFLLSFSIAEMGDSVRAIARFAADVASRMWL